MQGPMSWANRHMKARSAGPGRILLRACGLTKAFGGRVVLREVEVKLGEGQVVLLRGDNGSGKTTLLNILSGNLAPDRGRIHFCGNGSQETFRFPRRWWQNLNPGDHFLPERVAREGFGRSWQETRLFPTVRLLDNVAVAGPHHPGENPLNVLFHPHRVRQAEVAAEAEAAALLESLGLGGRSHSSADMISLGQTKRVAIARAVSAGGKVLFLDEPLAGLDTDGIQAVLNLLRQIAVERNVTLVIIEHVWNAHHILGFATTLWTLRDGQLSTESLDLPARAEANAPGDAALACLHEFLATLRCAETLVLPRGADLSIYGLPERTGAGEPLLEVQDIILCRGRRPVIGDEGHDRAPQSGLTFRLRDGEIAILRAPNGWGKTTLFEALAGILPVARGNVRLLGSDVTKSRTWERSRAGLHLLRAASRAFPSLTVQETFALSRAGAPPPALASLRRQDMRQLSGGEQQAVSLALAQASAKHVYLLDEPFSALDGRHVADTLQAIRELACHERAAVLLALPSTDVAP
jgi:ABC-type branched-subunit amino acid transport system ATPase component